MPRAGGLGMARSQCSGEGLVQQRRFHRLQRRKLLLVEAFEALAFGLLSLVRQQFLVADLPDEEIEEPVAVAGSQSSITRFEPLQGYDDPLIHRPC